MSDGSRRGVVQGDSRCLFVGTTLHSASLQGPGSGWHRAAHQISITLAATIHLHMTLAELGGLVRANPSFSFE